MKKKRKKQQVDNRANIIVLMTATISLINSIIALIITLAD
ncbi:hypothetical protein J2Z66_004171 [Paenibacillus eucommiae]|uniref:DUF4044 domain-containing protein n=1 Tax=Paenibacillus eucommiae TaxID=1355755 RepID=A0ABS4IY98_9BACL|nr:hypothetical protein [Paenibacillus eucommiae]